MAKSCCKYFTVSLVPIAALLLAFLFACGIITLPILYSELSRKYEYGLVLDGGSSHTTLYLYRVGVPITGIVEELDNHSIDTSLNSFADNPSGAGNMVENLLQYAKGVLKGLSVPDSMFNHTRVYLGATAGMRLLRNKNQSISEAIMKSADDAVRSSGLESKHRKTGIISGKEEAASGWVAANYLLNGKGLIGSLDMGGASTEIAFSVDPNDNQSLYHEKEMLLGQTEHIYARSYLCYGHNEALARFLAHLHSRNTTQLVNVSNPCLPKDFVKNHTIADIYRLCVNGSDAEKVFGFSLTPPPDIPDSTNVSFVGTGNLDLCVSTTEEVFDFYNCTINKDNCNSGQYWVPPVKGRFVGFSGFYYIAKILMLDGPFSNSTSVVKAMRERCRNLTVETPPTAKNADLCFFGVFMGYMLEQGFGMNKTAKADWSLEFKETEGSSSFGWALGYFMNKTYKFPDHPTHHVEPFSTVDMVVGMVILTILCAVFVIFFFLTFYACRKALKSHNGYQSIS